MGTPTPEGTRLDRFFGKHEYTLDAQRRVTLPRGWRQDAPEANAFVLMAGPYRSLQLIPEDLFGELLRNVHPKLQFEDRSDYLTLGSIGENAEKLGCDKQGRLALSQSLLEYAGIKDRLLLIGAIERIQVWEPSGWEAYRMKPEQWLDAFLAIEKRSGDAGAASRAGI